MTQRKKLTDLVFKDNFMFGAVMTEEENCRLFLEMVLGFCIEKVVVSREKSIAYHPEYKGVRLDVFAKDSSQKCYNVEMQVARKPELGRRARYYRGQIDMELLLTGMGYEQLPDTYIIFICDFDPFEKQRYCYTFESRCMEEDFPIADGSRVIFLNTHGNNPQEVSQSMVKFLNFVRADLEGSSADFQDSLVGRLQNSIRRIKTDREMEARYMLLQELIQDERNEAREEGKEEGMIQGKIEMILDLLEDLGTVQEEVHDRLTQETDPEVLKKIFKLAKRANSMEEFTEAIQSV